MGDGWEDDEEGYTFYKDREDWKDVTPIPQNDGPVPVVLIAHSDRFKDVHDYFRAVLKSEEKSKRVLQLTEDALELNPANYTVWNYRREVLKAIDADLREELRYSREMIEDHPKNYQVWQHRRVLVEWLNDAGAELRFTEVVLNIDQKNYHAWQHRQWVLQTFKLFDNELEFIDRLLLDDIRNNSAWNQRFFVIQQTTGWTEEVVTREVDFTWNKIKIVKRNESAWNYLRGTLQHCEDPDTASSQRTVVTTKCEELLHSGCDSPYLLGFLVELYKAKLEDSEEGDRVDLVKRVTGLCDRLAQDIDVVRCKYWTFISDCVTRKYTAVA